MSDDDRDARIEAAIEKYYQRQAEEAGDDRRQSAKARTLARKAGRRRKAQERGA